MNLRDTPLMDPTLLDQYPLTFSFAAAGWLQMYHFGVGKALQECGLADRAEIKMAGTSAGSIAATALAVGVDMDELREYAVRCSKHCRSSLKNAFILREYVLRGVDEYAVQRMQDDPTLAGVLNRRLEVYATRLPFCSSKKFEGCFDTPEDIGEALAASCCLTPIAGFPFQLRKTGEWVCDGGLTAFQPRGNDPNVVTVNALYPIVKACIRPHCYIPVWWGLYPPNEQAYREVYDIAYNDAIRYLVQAGHVDESKLELLRPVKIATLRGSMTAIGSEGNSLIHLLYTFCKDTVIVLFCFCIVRPAVMFLIYLEIWLWAALCMGLAFFHEAVHSFWWALDMLVNLVWGKPQQNSDSNTREEDAFTPGSVCAPEGEVLSPEDQSSVASTEGSGEGCPGSPSTASAATNRRGPSRQRGNRKWRDVYHSARNLVSFRTWAYLNFMGDTVPINYKRLEKSSRLYRLLRPMVYDRDVADDHHHDGKTK